MEIIGLAQIEEKIAPVLSKLTINQLNEKNESYAPLLPPFIWASKALDFN